MLEGSGGMPPRKLNFNSSEMAFRTILAIYLLKFFIMLYCIKINFTDQFSYYDIVFDYS